jgi:5-methylcytosine-specific restriction endonuclease McrA
VSKWNKANPDKMCEASKRYYRRNAEKCKEAARQRSAALKTAAFAFYGTACACCGIDGEPFLTIDHIVPAGHRKSAYEKKSLYQWLKSQGYPSGFQTLCWNCNMAKSDKQCCPHQK